MSILEADHLPSFLPKGGGMGPFSTTCCILHFWFCRLALHAQQQQVEVGEQADRQGPGAHWLPFCGASSTHTHLAVDGGHAMPLCVPLTGMTFQSPPPPSPPSTSLLSLLFSLYLYLYLLRCLPFLPSPALSTILLPFFCAPPACNSITLIISPMPVPALLFSFLLPSPHLW